MASNGPLEAILPFLEDLSAHNNTAWFKDNRRRYEADFLMPATILVEEIGAKLKKIDRQLQAVPTINKSIKRLNRDLRFSKDKTPYNPRLHLQFWLGEKPKFSPAFHVVFRPDHFGFGCGLWELSPTQLEAYRTVCLHKNKVQALNKALSAMTKAKGGHRSEPALKTPYGEACDWNAEHLKYKNIVVMGEAKLTKKLQKSGTDDAVIETFLKQEPVYKWIKTNLV